MPSSASDEKQRESPAPVVDQEVREEEGRDHREQQRQVQAGYLMKKDDRRAEECRRQDGAPRGRSVESDYRGDGQHHQELGGDEVRVHRIVEVAVRAAEQEAAE